MRARVPIPQPALRLEASVMLLQRSGFCGGRAVAAGRV